MRITAKTLTDRREWDVAVRSARRLAYAIPFFTGLLIASCAVGRDGDDGDGGALVEEEDSGGGTAKRDSSFTPFDGGKPASPDDVGDAEVPDAKPVMDAGPRPDAGPVSNPASCMTANSCPSAIEMGAVSGDVGSESQNATGNTAKWLSVRVGENNDSLFGGQKLKLKAVLVSPPGVNFDLFMYVNPNTDAQECASILGSSNNTASTDSATIEYGEGTIPNGSDDGRTVSIEVRYISGVCDPNTKWTLEVTGNP